MKDETENKQRRPNDEKAVEYPTRCTVYRKVKHRTYLQAFNNFRRFSVSMSKQYLRHLARTLEHELKPLLRC